MAEVSAFYSGCRSINKLQRKLCFRDLNIASFYWQYFIFFFFLLRLKSLLRQRSKFRVSNFQLFVSSKRRESLRGREVNNREAMVSCTNQSILPGSRSAKRVWWIPPIWFLNYLALFTSAFENDSPSCSSQQRIFGRNRATRVSYVSRYHVSQARSGGSSTT